MALYHLLESLLMATFLLTTDVTASDGKLRNDVEVERTILQGTLLGTTLESRYGRNIYSFLGIPYAQPPIGNLRRVQYSFSQHPLGQFDFRSMWSVRFANSVAAGSWNGTLNATVERSMCPQISITSSELMGDEDCLHLNVYTPQETNSSLLPVMVYIHGGGFRGDYPGPSGPEYLLDADVVLVTFHYRLGPLGYLCTGDEVASGNWGQKDQVLVLKWVQDNIHFFGGDPDQVTVFGQSAGATSVHLLALSDTTIGLFHKYITQSGSALVLWAHRPRSAYSSRAWELGEYVGCYNDTSESLISCLREIPFSDIINTAPQFYEWESLPKTVWGPTDEPDIEGAFMTDSPSNLLAAGKIRDIPWINGVVRDDGLTRTSSYYSNEELLADFVRDIDIALPLLMYWIYEPDSWEARINATKSYYFADYSTANSSEILKNFTRLMSEGYFFHPAYTALKQQNTSFVNQPYFYLFDYRGTFSFSYTFSKGNTANLGVCHGDDLIYLFPKQSEFVALNETMSEKDYEMVDAMVQLWTSFAINGTPTASCLGDTIWEPYSSEADNYLRIGNDSDVAFDVQYSFYREEMEFWNQLYSGSVTQDDSSENVACLCKPTSWIGQMVIIIWLYICH